MHDQLYIPNTITVGFQERNDTFTGKLAYVIYTDHAGKLRKEGSWNNWRNKKFEPVTVDNTPQSGFTFNKGVKRDNYWRGSGRSMFRIWDPRDFEFEITVDNTIGVLMHSDVSKRDIVEQCVYAWWGTELVLLPVNSVEYQESVKHTEKQAQKITGKELKVGATYTIKEDRKQVVYLGRFERFGLDSTYTQFGGEDSRYNHYHERNNAFVQTPKKSKAYVFIDPTTKMVHTKDPVKYLAYCDDETMHPEYAALMEKYYMSAESQVAVGVIVQVDDTSNYHQSMFWKEIGENQFVCVQIDQHAYNSTERISVYRFARFDEATRSIQFSYEASDRHYHYQPVTYPAFNLPGMDKNRADVVQLIAGIKQDVGGATRDAATMRYLKNKYNLGQLQLVLQNGNFAEDHILTY